jgi:hypothetical protein
MSTGSHYILVDFENCPHETARGLRGSEWRLIIFIGPNQNKLPLDLVEALQPMGERVRFIRIGTPGKNSLDFHLALLLGQLVAEDPLGSFYVVSKDQGFDPIIKYLVDRAITASRFGSVEAIRKATQAAPDDAAPPAVKAGAQSGKQPPPTGAASSEIVASTADLLIKRLKNPKATKPRSVKTVAAVIKTIASPQLLPDQVQMVIALLQDQGQMKLSSNGRVTYQFEEPR